MTNLGLNPGFISSNNNNYFVTGSNLNPINKSSLLLNTAEPSIETKYRNEANSNRQFRPPNKYRHKPKFQRNKSTEYQPVTRYIMDDFLEAANIINSNYESSRGENYNTFNGMNTASAATSPDLTSFLANQTNHTSSRLGLNQNTSKEPNAQRLRKNFKRTTSV